MGDTLSSFVSTFSRRSTAGGVPSGGSFCSHDCAKSASVPKAPYSVTSPSPWQRQMRPCSLCSPRSWPTVTCLPMFGPWLPRAPAMTMQRSPDLIGSFMRTG
jgi:hypothetical protein